jgi:hypothetical protein
VAETNALLKRHTGNCIEGSNPSVSASKSQGHGPPRGAPEISRESGPFFGSFRTREIAHRSLRPVFPATFSAAIRVSTEWLPGANCRLIPVIHGPAAYAQAWNELDLELPLFSRFSPVLTG